MAASVIKKYGLVPKHAMPETNSSNSTAIMNRNLATKVCMQHCMVWYSLDWYSSKNLYTEEMNIFKFQIISISIGDTVVANDTIYQLPNSNIQLRSGARSIREYVASGASSAVVKEEKQVILEAVYRILAIHLGIPPKAFHWQVGHLDCTEPELYWLLIAAR